MPQPSPADSPRRSHRSWIAAVGAVALRPALWPTATRQARRTVRSDWWRRAPFLPLPDRGYLRFRLETQYGEDSAPASGDLVTYLEWCRAEEQASPHGASGTHR
jgi:hypothetical protein